MTVTLDFTAGTCTVKRTADDRRFRDGGQNWGSAESGFLYNVKKALLAQGYDVIKKRMWKDGHMYGGDDTQYIRERHWKFAVYDGDYALRNMAEEFNRLGEIILCLASGEEW